MGNHAKLKVAFIGTGNMAGAIIKGLAQTQADEVAMGLYDLDTAKAAALAKATGSVVLSNLKEAAQFGDLLVLAVKPQSMEDLLTESAPYIRTGQLLVSVAAGVELRTYEEYLPEAAVARAMPNTSCAVLAAITGLMAGRKIKPEHKEILEQIFGAIGETIWIDETDIHALIAVSGSGPAYYYYFTEQLAKVGAEMGLSPEVADKLARYTAIGAGKMLAEKVESPEDLRLQVTSPKGTTYEAIEAFSKALPGVVKDAMEACAKRSKEMAKS